MVSFPFKIRRIFIVDRLPKNRKPILSLTIKSKKQWRASYRVWVLQWIKTIAAYLNSFYCLIRLDIRVIWAWACTIQSASSYSFLLVFFWGQFLSPLIVCFRNYTYYIIFWLNNIFKDFPGEKNVGKFLVHVLGQIDFNAKNQIQRIYILIFSYSNISNVITSNIFAFVLKYQITSHWQEDRRSVSCKMIPLMILLCLMI
jgi:hypothetical protein